MASKFQSSTFSRSDLPTRDHSVAVDKARGNVDLLMKIVVNDARAAGVTHRAAVDAITDQALKRSVTGRLDD